MVHVSDSFLDLACGCNVDFMSPVSQRSHSERRPNWLGGERESVTKLERIDVSLGGHGVVLVPDTSQRILLDEGWYRSVCV